MYRGENKEALVTPEMIDRYCDLVDTHGTDFWWSMSEEQILGGSNPEGLVKGKDILDVWFDSGLTWTHALPPAGDTGLRQSQVYLEGLDQFSGWFYSSLITGMALQVGEIFNFFDYLLISTSFPNGGEWNGYLFSVMAKWNYILKCGISHFMNAGKF